MIEIYTDGSATKSRSGWGFVAVKNNEIIYQKSGVEHIGDTNQMMELIAALEACKWATNQHYDDIIIYSDSAYLVNCYNDKWFVKWENNNFKIRRGCFGQYRNSLFCVYGYFINPTGADRQAT